MEFKSFIKIADFTAKNLEILITIGKI